MQPQASLLVQLGFVALSLAVLGAVALGIARYAGRRDALRFSVAAAAWLAFTGVLASSGFFAVFEGWPPRLALLLLPSLGLPIGLAFSRVGTALLRAPVGLLVAAQAFRLPLELLMHRAAAEQLMPPQMSFTGYNLDIVTGATALVVAALCAAGRAPRWLVVAWNLLGTALLINILVIAVLSLPQIGAFGDDPSRVNTWVAFFPFVWLPAALVTTAVFGHTLLWRWVAFSAMRGRVFA